MGSTTRLLLRLGVWLALQHMVSACVSLDTLVSSHFPETTSKCPGSGKHSYPLKTQCLHKPDYQPPKDVYYTTTYPPSSSAYMNPMPYLEPEYNSPKYSPYVAPYVTTCTTELNLAYPTPDSYPAPSPLPYQSSGTATDGSEYRLRGNYNTPPAEYPTYDKPCYTNTQYQPPSCTTPAPYTPPYNPGYSASYQAPPYTTPAPYRPTPAPYNPPAPYSTPPPYTQVYKNREYSTPSYPGCSPTYQVPPYTTPAPLYSRPTPAPYNPPAPYSTPSPYTQIYKNREYSTPSYKTEYVISSQQTLPYVTPVPYKPAPYPTPAPYQPPCQSYPTPTPYRPPSYPTPAPYKPAPYPTPAPYQPPTYKPEYPTETPYTETEIRGITVSSQSFVMTTVKPATAKATRYPYVPPYLTYNAPNEPNYETNYVEQLAENSYPSFETQSYSKPVSSYSSNLYKREINRDNVREEQRDETSMEKRSAQYEPSLYKPAATYNPLAYTQSYPAPYKSAPNNPSSYPSINTGVVNAATSTPVAYSDSYPAVLHYPYTTSANPATVSYASSYNPLQNYNPVTPSYPSKSPTTSSYPYTSPSYYTPPSYPSAASIYQTSSYPSTAPIGYQIPSYPSSTASYSPASSYPSSYASLLSSYSNKAYPEKSYSIESPQYSPYNPAGLYDYTTQPQYPESQTYYPQSYTSNAPSLSYSPSVLPY